jgi:hypothetical protein
MVIVGRGWLSLREADNDQSVAWRGGHAAKGPGTGYGGRVQIQI